MVVGGMKFKTQGVSFGGCRHTFESAALRVGDKPLVDFLMGHSRGDMSEWYDHPPIADMKRVVEGVYARLFQSDESAKTGPTPGAGVLRLAS